MKAVYAIADGLRQLPKDGKHFAEMLVHGTLLVEVYAPPGADKQGIHTRDEVYVVASGTGVFVTPHGRELFKPSDLLFVPAGVQHRFEEFSEDFAVWVMFYGPEGGEARPAPS